MAKSKYIIYKSLYSSSKATATHYTSIVASFTNLRQCYLTGATEHFVTRPKRSVSVSVSSIIPQTISIHVRIPFDSTCIIGFTTVPMGIG